MSIESGSVSIFDKAHLIFTSTMTVTEKSRSYRAALQECVENLTTSHLDSAQYDIAAKNVTDAHTVWSFCEALFFADGRSKSPRGNLSPSSGTPFSISFAVNKKKIKEQKNTHTHTQIEHFSRCCQMFSLTKPPSSPPPLCVCVCVCVVYRLRGSDATATDRLASDPLR